MTDAKIISTHLGYEDHGIMTFFLYLTGDGWGQGFGGYFLANENTLDWIKGILDTVGVRRWEQLEGKFCRIEREDGLIRKLGHITDNRWVYADKETGAVFAGTIREGDRNG